MPTPVSNARQCLAAEAAAALDDAVAVARRRVHAQTTSLHVVYALLHPSGGGSNAAASTASPSSSSSSSSLLRDALSRARSAAFSSRLQFKALELCFGVALDRLPSSTPSHHQQADGVEDPPVSNSLMAAIKRSQANQRRNPDTFHLYQQQSCGASSSTSSSGVKVELQQLVLAILDDPVVSRVFSDAGFRSSDIKLAVLRPPPPILRFPGAARYPPLFLCNFSSGDGFDAAFSPRGFPFPLASPSGGQPCSDGGEGNCRRIGEILVRRSGGRNPMLVGAGAGEAALDFARAIEKHDWTVLPPELRGIKLVSIEKKVSELKNSCADRSAVSALLEEIPRNLDAPGAVLSVGDLKEMVQGQGEGGNEQESFLVSEITRLLEVHQGRMWVMGCSANYETYMKFLSKYPLLDKDWDLQLLPITSVSGMSGLISKPPSSMESFAPFGVVFPATSEPKSPSIITYPSGLRCEHCGNKYEQELSALLKEHSTSIEDKQSTNLPFWLQKTRMTSITNNIDVNKAKDDKSVLNSKIMDLQRKWNEHCQGLHHSCQTIGKDQSQAIPRMLELPNVSDQDLACDQSSENPGKMQNQREYGIHAPLSADLQKKDADSQYISLPSNMEKRKEDLEPELQVQIPSIKHVQVEGFHSNQDGHHDERVSPSSVTSVLTDLVLASPCKREKIVAPLESDSIMDISKGFPSKKIGTFRGSTLCIPIDSSYTSSSGCARSTLTQSVSKVPSVHGSTRDQFLPMSTCQKFDISNYKSFYTCLIDKVGRQEEAISSIVQAISHRRMGERHGVASLKGDLWLGFHGSDRIAKKKTALALAELMCGSKENFIYVDLSYQGGIGQPCTICNQQGVNVYDVNFRGKTHVDYIAENLHKKPKSVVFLENIDKADFLVQNSLLHAVRNGKFPNSHGREFRASDATFIVTTTTCEAKTQSQRDCINFCEETVLAAQCSQMVISVKQLPEGISSSTKSNVSGSPRQKFRNEQVSLSSGFVTKRKLDTSDNCTNECESMRYVKRAHKSTTALIDLNMPVEEYEANDVDTSQTNLASDSSDEWMEEFFNLLNARIDFQPFNFDALAVDIMKDLSQRFSSAVGSECSLEIDPRAMVQILAAAWSAEDRGPLVKWFDQVLGKSFFELSRRYSLSAHTVVRLVASEEACTEKHATGVVLPSKIILD